MVSQWLIKVHECLQFNYCHSLQSLRIFTFGVTNLQGLILHAEENKSLRKAMLI